MSENVKLTNVFIESAATIAHGVLWDHIRASFAGTAPPTLQTWEGMHPEVREAWRHATRETIGVTLAELQRLGYLREGVQV
jgi:hypothetical protein